MIVAEDSLTGPGDRRIPIQIHLDGDGIVEGDTWDGTDFCDATGTVTTRFLDFLLAVHAFPFVAEPVLVDVSRMTEAQRKMLDESQELPGLTT
jgi:hypothetical protein